MTHKLSDNEKAATFIRGKPSSLDRRCDICGAIESDVEPQWRLGHLFSPPALLPVPDMSRPENYMRALEEGCDGWEKSTHWYVRKNGWTGVGRTPVEALADLHDALKEK